MAGVPRSQQPIEGLVCRLKAASKDTETIIDVWIIHQLDSLFWEKALLHMRDCL